MANSTNIDILVLTQLQAELITAFTPPPTPGVQLSAPPVYVVERIEPYAGMAPFEVQICSSGAKLLEGDSSGSVDNWDVWFTIGLFAKMSKDYGNRITQTMLDEDRSLAQQVAKLRGNVTNGGINRSYLLGYLVRPLLCTEETAPQAFPKFQGLLMKRITFKGGLIRAV